MEPAPRIEAFAAAMGEAFPDWRHLNTPSATDNPYLWVEMPHSADTDEAMRVMRSLVRTHELRFADLVDSLSDRASDRYVAAHVELKVAVEGRIRWR